MKKDDWRDLSDANGDGYFDRHGARDFKRVKVRWWVWPIVWFIAGLGVWQCSHAQVVYQYTGAPLNPLGSYVPIITGTVTLAEQLGPNGTQVVAPVSAAFTGNLVIATDNESFNVGSSFSFTTVNGVITAWSVITQGYSGSAVATTTVSSEGDSYDINVYATDCQFVPQKCSDTFTSNTIPGTWAIPQAEVVQSMATMQAQLTTTQASIIQQRAEITAYATMASTLSIDYHAYLNGYIAEYHMLQTEGSCILTLRRGGKC